MKTCINCGETKTPPKFAKHSGFVDGRRTTCKVCYNTQQKSDISRFIRKMYATQKASSTKRGHPAPAYTLDEFSVWILAQSAFGELWEAYQASGHVKDLAPSADRVNSNAPYTLDNLFLVTWSVNNQRGIADTKNGVKITQHRKVAAYYPDGQLFKLFESLHAAARVVGGNATNIQRVADKTVIRKPDGRTSVLRKSKGYLWEWYEETNK